MIPVQEKPLPLIVVPTTAGTGSELSFAAVFSDHEAKKKTQIYNYEIVPLVAIIDPIMMMNAPAGLTAAAGFDALVHAIESYVCKNANPYSEALSAKAIGLLIKGLVPACTNGKNMKARAQMAYGSTFAGMAMSASGLGINHALAYPLTTHHDAPHGTANAVFLPYSMTFNAQEVPEKYANIAELMGIDVRGLAPKEASLKGIELIVSLLEELKVPKTIQDFGVKPEEFPVFAETILIDYVPLCMFNPRSMNPFEAYELYQNAYNGDRIWKEKLGS
jgi:alcohol dehydrogenase class IV